MELAASTTKAKRKRKRRWPPDPKEWELFCLILLLVSMIGAIVFVVRNMIAVSMIVLGWF